MVKDQQQAVGERAFREESPAPGTVALEPQRPPPTESCARVFWLKSQQRHRSLTFGSGTNRKIAITEEVRERVCALIRDPAYLLPITIIAVAFEDVPLLYVETRRGFAGSRRPRSDAQRSPSPSPDARSRRRRRMFRVDLSKRCPRRSSATSGPAPFPKEQSARRIKRHAQAAAIKSLGALFKAVRVAAWDLPLQCVPLPPTTEPRPSRRFSRPVRASTSSRAANLGDGRPRSPSARSSRAKNPKRAYGTPPFSYHPYGRARSSTTERFRLTTAPSVENPLSGRMEFHPGERREKSSWIGRRWRTASILSSARSSRRCFPTTRLRRSVAEYAATSRQAADFTGIVAWTMMRPPPPPRQPRENRPAPSGPPAFSAP